MPGLANFDLGIDKPGGTDQLLDHQPIGLLELVVAGGRRNIYRLIDQPLPFLEVQRPVVERGREPEAELDQSPLARSVAAVHPAELRDGDVALVDEHQVVVREIIQQRGRRLSRRAAGQMARIVLDSGAESHLGQQFQIVQRALLQALSFEQPVVRAKEFEPLLELGADIPDRDFHPVGGRYVMRGGIDRDALELANHLAAQRIDLVQRLDLIAEKLDPHRPALFIGREHLDRVAAHAEGPAMEIVVVALVPDIHQLAQHPVAIESLPLLDKHQHVEVHFRLAKPVDAGDRGDDQNIVALQQGFGRRMAQLVDLVVDAGVLLDIGVGGRNVGFGLIVVVIRNEVADRVFRKQALEFVV